METGDTVKTIDHIDHIMEASGVIHNTIIMPLGIHVHIQDMTIRLDMLHLHKVNIWC